MLTVVTGASGFLGGVLVRKLLAEGRHVRCVDLRCGPGLDDLDIEWMPADVLNRSSLTAAFDGAGVVYHLAAVISVTGDPSGRVWATNVDGVANTAKAALATGVERLVHCSSVHAYDLEAVERVTEESPRAILSSLPTYDRSKAAGEATLRKFIDRGLDAVIVNPTGVVGPPDFTGSRMNSVLLALFQGRLPALVAGGFDWVDARDVASTMLAAERNGRCGENYLLPGHRRSIQELAAVAEEVSGQPKPALTVPMWLARMGSPVANVIERQTGNPLLATSEALHALRFSPTVSGAKAQTELGHRPRPIETTVSDVHQWACEQGFLDDTRKRSNQATITR